MAKGHRRTNARSIRDIYRCTDPVRYVRGREESGMTMRLSLLMEGVAGDSAPFRDVEVRGVTCDSRQVQPGFLFVAVSGTRADGTAYVEDAVRRGAVAVVAEHAPAKAVDVPVVVVKDARTALAEAASRY